VSVPAAGSPISAGQQERPPHLGLKVSSTPPVPGMRWPTGSAKRPPAAGRDLATGRGRPRVQPYQLDYGRRSSGRHMLNGTCKLRFDVGNQGQPPFLTRDPAHVHIQGTGVAVPRTAALYPLGLFNLSQQRELTRRKIERKPISEPLARVSRTLNRSYSHISIWWGGGSRCRSPSMDAPRGIF
jgi:hypothetical protein